MVEPKTMAIESAFSFQVATLDSKELSLILMMVGK